MPKISPCLWFDDQAEEAAQFYASVFGDAHFGAISRYGKEGFDVHRQPEGRVLTAEFQLAGIDFVGLNGGPQFEFTEAISFQIICDTQDEIDHYWDKLSDGGDPKAQQCGWLKDKFGLSWQVVPALLPKLLKDGDKERSGRVMNALLKMNKLDIAALQRAYAG